MQNLERINEQIKKSGKADKLKSLAESEDGKALSRMLDASAVEQAAKSGDAAALQNILNAVLGTEEGRRLAESIKNAMR